MGKQFKGFILGFIFACLLVVPTTALADNIQAQFNAVNITVDGNSAVKQGENYQLTDGSTVPFSISYKGTTYIPIRKISELLGIGINYDNASKTVQVASNSNAAKVQDKPVENKTTSAAVTYSTSYSVFNECDKNSNSNGDKVAHVSGFTDGKRIDTNFDYSYYKSISSNINSILLWETTYDSKGNLTKLKAVSNSKSGKVVDSNNRESVKLSSGEFNFENNAVIYQWTDDNEYKIYSGKLKSDDNVYLYDINGNKKYDVAIFTRDYKGKVAEGDTTASKETSNTNTNDSSTKEKQNKATTGYAVINECQKTVNDEGDKVQTIAGFKDGTMLKTLTSEQNLIKDWNEPKYSKDGFSNSALYKISLNSKSVIISAEKVDSSIEQGKAEQADKRNDVTIAGKTYKLSSILVMYRVDDNDEYRVYNGDLKTGDILQLYETDSSKDGYDIVIFSRP
nr:stalk domain-containing protein [uncultured Aminipila sp.]